MLATFLDDSEPSKIRKSIFIFASIAMFTSFYKLNISAPHELFSSAIPENNKVNISYVHVLKMLAVFQAYLLCRLFISSRISFAIFNKNWKIDEFKEDEDLTELQKELSEFKVSAQTKIALKSDLKATISRLDELIIRQDEMSKIITEACDISGKTVVAQQQLADAMYEAPTVDNQYVGFITGFKNFNDLEMTSLRGNIDNFNKRIKEVRGSINSSLDELQNFELKLSKFNQSFPSSNYEAVTKINQRSLINSRRIKVQEMWLFELIVPTLVGGISLFVCLNPESMLLSNILKFIF